MTVQVRRITASRRRTILASVATVGLVVGVTLGVTSAGNASTPDATLAGILQSFAQANGDANPTSMQMVASDRTSALSVLSPGVSVGSKPGGVSVGSTPVYALTATGNFTAYNAKVPPGAQLPTGTTLWMIVNAQDPTILLDWGVTNLTPNLSTLGTPTSL